MIDLEVRHTLSYMMSTSKPALCTVPTLGASLGLQHMLKCWHRCGHLTLQSSPVLSSFMFIAKSGQQTEDKSPVSAPPNASLSLLPACSALF